MEDIIKTVEITSVFSISRLKGQKHLKLSKVLTSQGIEKRTVGYKGLQLLQKQDIKKSSNINVCYKRIHLSLTMSMSCMWLKVKLSCHSWNHQNGLGWDLQWGKKNLNLNLQPDSNYRKSLEACLQQKIIQTRKENMSLTTSVLKKDNNQYLGFLLKDKIEWFLF